MKSFTGGYIPKYTILYFRIPINTKNKNAVTVKLLNNEVYPRSIYVFFYSKKPTDEEEMVEVNHIIRFIEIPLKKTNIIQTIYILLMKITVENTLL